MAGAGKSSVGKELAKKLDFRLIDSDVLIEEQYGKSLQKILDDEGYIALREIENLVLKNLYLNETILSTGGSAVYSEEAMEYIKNNTVDLLFLDLHMPKLKGFDFLLGLISSLGINEKQYSMVLYRVQSYQE